MDLQTLQNLVPSAFSDVADAALKQLQKLSQNVDYTLVECGLTSGVLTGFSYEIAASQKLLFDVLGYSVGLNGNVTYPAGGVSELTGEPVPGGTITGHNGLYSPGPTPEIPGLISPNPNHAKAQDIADRIARAVQQAKESDERYGPALENLDGIPSEVRDKANRENLNILIGCPCTYWRSRTRDSVVPSSRSGTLTRRRTCRRTFQAAAPQRTRGDVGSPGVGVDHASDLGVGNDHVFVDAAENDPRQPTAFE